ncbi:hypothetical protein [Clostridium sporogenes]|uniref:hypothetical protein n=1 Tax=Clostridium sporogenes TaxID=1509 RepID=UPI000934BA49|nr:hypothetical protein [Clostridium sporogenes]
MGRTQSIILGRDESSDYMKRIFNDTKHYHDGKCLLIRIQDDKYINELIEIKKKPKCISESMLLK